MLTKAGTNTRQKNDKIECPLLYLIQAWILFHFGYSLQSGVCQGLSQHVLGFQLTKIFLKYLKV